MSAETPRSLRTKSSRPGRRTSRTAFTDDPPEPDDPLLGFAPYIHSRPRRNSITPYRQRAFISELAATGIVTQAARAIGASLEALYKLRHMPGAAGFSAAWDAALDRGIARLEDCALERALLGEERPVVRGREVVTTWRRYDTQLILFLLRQRRRERFDADGLARMRGFAPALEDEDTVLASLDAKLEVMRRQWLAAQAAEPEENGDAAG